MKYFFLFFFLIIFTLSFSQARPSLIPYRKGDLWGYCDTSKNIVIPVQYEMAYPFVNGKALVKTAKNSLQIDVSGKTVRKLKCMFGHADYGMLSFMDSKTEKYGVMDFEGNVMIEAKYDYLYIDARNVVRASIADTKGSLDRQGKIVSEFVYSDQDENDFVVYGNFCPDQYCIFKGTLQDGIHLAGFKGQFGYCDLSGNPVSEFKYSLAQEFSHGLGYVSAEKPGQTRVSYTDENGTFHDSGVRLVDGYVDRKGVEYWED